METHGDTTEATAATAAPASAPVQMPFAELVTITAAIMALNALAIDMMLPALGVIGNELGALRDNDRQLIVVVYVIANGVGQLFFGPIVDRFGRRRVLLWSLAGYAAGSLLSIFAGSFALLLAARAFQGVATAATRVASIAIVRDQCSGRRMAEVMSLAITIFMAAPVIAPAIGQAILAFFPWRGIFVALLAYGLALAVWAFLRCPETLRPADAKPLNAASIIGAYGEFVANRVALGYTLGSALCFGALFGYVSSSEQIFLETFNLGARFPLAFAAVAASLGAATLINSRLVGKYGMRRLLHGALIVLIAANVVHLGAAAMGQNSILVFIAFMSISFFCLGLIGPNSSALAMEPMGHMAGAAGAANGFAGTTIAGVLGGVVGAFYDGTTAPLIAGFLILGVGALGVVLWVEKGALFKGGPIK